MESPNPVRRFRDSPRRDGVVSTVRRSLGVPLRLFRHWQMQYRKWRFNHSDDAKVIFKMAYELNFWDSKESVSGPGSTLA
jgi:hypothetical protein